HQRRPAGCGWEDPGSGASAASHQRAAQPSALHLPAVIGGQLPEGSGAACEVRRDPVSARRVPERPGQPAAITRGDQVGDLAEGHYAALLTARRGPLSLLWSVAS